MVYYILVVRVSIGLDFVMNKDKNWRKHIKSLDRTNEEESKNYDIFKIEKFEKKTIEQNIENKNLDFDYWNYWKKRYLILK